MAKRERRKAGKRWRRTELDSDLAAFEVKRNAATALMNKARREFYTNFIEENSWDQKKLFAASNRFIWYIWNGSGTALEWFRSYLNGRSQRVTV